MTAAAAPRARWRRALDVAFWAGTAALALVLWTRITPPAALPDPLGPAPEVAGVTLTGEPFRLSDLAGEVVVLNFWATWCLPCHAETPGFVRLQERLAARGVRFVGVSLDAGGAADVGPFAERYGIAYPLVLHGGEAAARYGGVRALPTTFVIDRAGQVRLRHEGFLLPAALRPTLEALARERPPR